MERHSIVAESDSDDEERHVGNPRNSLRNSLKNNVRKSLRTLNSQSNGLMKSVGDSLKTSLGKGANRLRGRGPSSSWLHSYS